MKQKYYKTRPKHPYWKYTSETGIDVAIWVDKIGRETNFYEEKYSTGGRAGCAIIGVNIPTCAVKITKEEYDSFGIK